MAADSSALQALARRIQFSVNEAGRCLITQPPDLALLHSLSDSALRDFAASHGWTVVTRLGGAQMEFFAVHLPRVPISLS